MVRKIIQIGDSRLLENSEKLTKEEINSQEIQELIKDLVETCRVNIDTAAGISAVQIGILKRICVVKDLRNNTMEEDEDKWLVLINPEIKKTSKDKSVVWEGCLSINSGKNRLFGPVERSKSVEIEYLDEKGQSKSLKAEGFFSHLIQHEIDHMNGILFLQYIENPKNIWLEDELDKYLAKYKEFPEVQE